MLLYCFMMDYVWLSGAVEVFRPSTQLLQLYISLNTLSHVAVGCYCI